MNKSFHAIFLYLVIIPSCNIDTTALTLVASKMPKIFHFCTWVFKSGEQSLTLYSDLLLNKIKANELCCISYSKTKRVLSIPAWFSIKLKQLMHRTNKSSHGSFEQFWYFCNSKVTPRNLFLHACNSNSRRKLYNGIRFPFSKV